MTPAPRYRGRTDANHKDVGDALKATKLWLVIDISSWGGGLGDWLTQEKTGQKIKRLIEVKDGSKPPSRRKLTPMQILRREEGWEIITVNGPDEALVEHGITGGA